MAPKKNSTPIKPLEGSTMTHEDEETKHEISKLQEQVHQISLSQRATKNEMEVLKKGMETKVDGLKKGVEANMNGLEAKMDDMKNDLKAYMEGLMTSLKPEMIPNGGNIGEEPHDENKINVNHDFINSNVGWKIHHITKIDIRNFYG